VWLRRAGYQTAFMGKYLNQYGDRDAHEVPPGWGYWRATVGIPYDYYNFTVNAGGDLRVHVGDYQTDYYADLTERLVPRLSARDRPFFLWQSHIAPHLARAAWPFLSGGEGWSAATPSSRYDGTLEHVSLPQSGSPAFNEADVSDKPRYIRDTPPLDREARRALGEVYQRRIESLRSVDDAVARTVDVLRRTGELDNTLLIFTSDNGYLLGQHRHKGKNVPYEPALQVPLLMRGPSVPTGVRSPATTTTVDLAPTVLAAAGAEAGLPVDGRNLLPVARGVRPGWDTTLIQGGPRTPEEGPRWFFRGVRTHRYTYVEYRQSGGVELYDRLMDPRQLRNVAGRAAYARVQAELRRRLLQLQDCAGWECRRHFGPLPEPRL
jgi:N-acetylglucosamine-6-sulfatase